jgi:hypothetical protein
MKYDLDYQGAAEILESRVRTGVPPITGRLLENSYLPEFNQDILEEAERLNVLLPLIKWEVDNNDLSEAVSDELYLYYEDLLKGSVTDNIGTVGEILLRDGRFGQTTGMGVVHSDEMVGLSRGNTGVGKSEGTNRANPLVHNGFARFSLCQ